MTESRRRRQGYTLAELLFVVAILGVLTAVGTVSVMRYRKNAMQAELDSKAEILFAAVQNSLSKIQAGGAAENVQYTDGSNGVHLFSGIPGYVYLTDAYADIFQSEQYGTVETLDEYTTASHSFCYFTSEDWKAGRAAAVAVMGKSLTDTIADEELLNANWVVEYDSESCLVRSVFYSGTAANCAAEYAGEQDSAYDTLRGTMAERHQLYDDPYRIDGCVGYYGGGSSGGGPVKRLRVEVKIENGEELTVTAICAGSSDAGAVPAFKVELCDGTTTNTKYYAHNNALGDYQQAIEKVAGTDKIVWVGDFPFTEDACISTSDTGYKLVLPLDSLTSEGSRFTEKYGANSMETEKLAEGAPLTVKVTAMIPGNPKIASASDTKTTNSLFGNAETDENGNAKRNDGTSADKPVVIACARHLQNLDESSGVSSAVQYAKQTADVDMSAGSGWCDAYGENYFNGTAKNPLGETVPNFRPIRNGSLLEYTVEENSFTITGLTVNATEDAGLFAQWGTAAGEAATLNGITLADACVKSSGSSAGALVGSVSGRAEIQFCRSYLQDSTVQKLKENSGGCAWQISQIGGKNAGGLVGLVCEKAELMINNSAAATVAGEISTCEDADGVGGIRIDELNSESVGGLVGRAEGGSTVAVDGSYADCYLYGKTTGGLIGESSGTISVSSSFVAGYAAYGTASAGLVMGAVDLKNSYTLLCPGNSLLSEPLQNSDAVYYSTAVSGTAENVFYAANGTAEDFDLDGSEKIENDWTGEQLLAKLGNPAQTLPGGTVQPYFEVNPAQSRVYSLMGQSAGEYPYPVLAGLRHYGDWEIYVEPEPPAEAEES